MEKKYFLFGSGSAIEVYQQFNNIVETLFHGECTIYTSSPDFIVKDVIEVAQQYDAFEEITEEQYKMATAITGESEKAGYQNNMIHNFATDLKEKETDRKYSEDTPLLMDLAKRIMSLGCPVTFTSAEGKFYCDIFVSYDDHDEFNINCSSESFEHALFEAIYWFAAWWKLTVYFSHNVRCSECNENEEIDVDDPENMDSFIYIKDLDTTDINCIREYKCKNCREKRHSHVCSNMTDEYFNL